MKICNLERDCIKSRRDKIGITRHIPFLNCLFPVNCKLLGFFTHTNVSIFLSSSQNGGPFQLLPSPTQRENSPVSQSLLGTAEVFPTPFHICSISLRMVLISLLYLSSGSVRTT